MRRAWLATSAVAILAMVVCSAYFWGYPTVSYGDDLILYNPGMFDERIDRLLSQHLLVNGRLASNLSHVAVAAWNRIVGWDPFEFPWAGSRILSLGLITLSAINLVFGTADRTGHRNVKACLMAAAAFIAAYTAHPYVIRSLYGYTAFMFVHTLPLYLASALLVSSGPSRTRWWGPAGAALFVYIALTSEQTLTLVPVLALFAAWEPSSAFGLNQALRRTATIVVLFGLASAAYYSVPSQRARLGMVRAGDNAFSVQQWLSLAHRPIGDVLGGAPLPPWVVPVSVGLAVTMLAIVIGCAFRFRRGAWPPPALAAYWSVAWYACFLASCIHYAMTPYNPPEAAVVPVFFLMVAAGTAVAAGISALPASPSLVLLGRVGLGAGALATVMVATSTLPDTLDYLGREIGKGSDRHRTYTSLIQRLQLPTPVPVHLQWCHPYWDSVGGIGALLRWAGTPLPDAFGPLYADGAWMPDGWMKASSLEGFSHVPCAVQLPPVVAAASIDEPLVPLRSAYHVSDDAGQMFGGYWIDFPLFRDVRACAVAVAFNPHPEVSPDLKARLEGEVDFPIEDARLDAVWRVRTTTPNAAGIVFDVDVVGADGSPVNPDPAVLPVAGGGLLQRPPTWPALLRLRVDRFAATYQTVHGINFTTMATTEIRCR